MAYKETIYTHDEAARIIERFEDILSRYSIVVPSPEDDERDADNMVGLYGSTYSDLFDRIEEDIISMLARHNRRANVVPYVFSGDYDYQYGGTE